MGLVREGGWGRPGEVRGMKMTHIHLNRERRLPLWAVIGAPLIGVPVMVGLLALTAPVVEERAIEPVPAFVAEPVDTHLVDPVSNESAELLEQELNAG